MRLFVARIRLSTRSGNHPSPAGPEYLTFFSVRSMGDHCQAIATISREHRCASSSTIPGPAIRGYKLVSLCHGAQLELEALMQMFEIAIARADTLPRQGTIEAPNVLPTRACA